MKGCLIWGNTLVLLAVLSALLTGCVSQLSDRKIHYIGVPDGAAGLLVLYVLREKMADKKIEVVTFEPHTLYDCCASASQYALGSGHLDIAIMCPDAARSLVNKDNRFVIEGPVIINSDILIARNGADFKDAAIGVSQKRMHQQQIIARRIGDRGKAVPMLHTAVPFAFSRGVVNGAVIDITRSFELPGTPVPRGEDEQNISTYVLVIKKSLVGNPDYLTFMMRYRKAVEEMKDKSRVLHLLRTYASAHITKGDVETWKRMNVHYTYPSISRPLGSNFPGSGEL